MEESLSLLTLNDLRNIAKDFWEYGQQSDTPVNPYNDEQFTNYINEFLKKKKDATT